jgi:NDP-sugar pyrophosphorylase family protein
MQAVILSGGLGTRLHPLTREVPKPMLPINGRPHLDYIISLLKKHGYDDIIFSTGYLHSSIVSHYGDAFRYKEDGDQLLGTAGALRNCLDLITEDDVLVMNGDILTDIDLSWMTRIHGSIRKPITMSILEVADATGFGLTPYNESGRVLEFLEKPTEPTAGPINAGIYIINKKVIERIGSGYSMLEHHVFPLYASMGKIQGVVSNEGKYHWIDIGTHERYAKAQEIGKLISTF